MASAHKHIQEKPKDSAAELDLAIYIDADNVSWKYSARIREIAQGLGVIRKAIAIGESQRFSGKAGWHTTNWVSHCPISTIGKKKNAADFEMTVRMGEDVASRKFDAFVVVSDDNDYITVAERLKARGKKVFGIGQGKAPASYRKVLNGYFDLTEQGETNERKSTVVKAAKTVRDPKGDLDGYCDRCLSPQCKVGCVLPEYGTRYCQWALAAAGSFYRHAGCSHLADGYWTRVVRLVCGTDELKNRQREELEKWVVAQDKRGLYDDFIDFARGHTFKRSLSKCSYRR